MRSLFSQYRISAALDAATPLPPALQQKLGADDRLRCYAQDLGALDQALRDSLPQPEAPSALRAAIMREVRSAGRPAVSAPMKSLLRWLPAPAFAALICLLLVRHNASPPTPSPGALQSASAVLMASGQIAHAAPASALAPLTEEWQRLNQDLDNTAQFLLATLP
jgi:hypothetical protein